MKLAPHPPKCSAKHITIIVPTYNVEKTIIRALKSIRDQDINESYKVYIVDDNSTDKTVLLAEEFVYQNNMNSHVIKLAKNHGDSGATPRNHALDKVHETHALDKVHETYVFYLDADNEWYPNHLKTCMELFTTGVGIVLSDYEIYNLKGQKIAVNNAAMELGRLDTSAMAHIEDSERWDTNLYWHDFALAYRLKKKGLSVGFTSKITAKYHVTKPFMEQLLRKDED